MPTESDHATANRRARQRNRTRRVTIHFSLGLFPGVLFAIIGFTRSLLAFWPELDVWQHADLMQVRPQNADREYRPFYAS